MSIRDVFVIKEVDLRLIQGEKPEHEESFPIGDIRPAGEERQETAEPHMVVGSRGIAPQHDFGLEIEMAINELSKIQGKLGQEMNFETFVAHVEHVREIVSSLRFEADRMLRLQDHI